MNEEVVAPQAVETAPLGTPTAPVGEALVPAPADDSLASHEAAHSPRREPERDAESGQFQPAKSRRRAASQQADADDVPTINALTARLKAAEDAAGKDIARKDGESERVFTLRRRAELAERHTAPPKPAASVPTAAPVQQPRQSPQFQPLPDFPEYEEFIQIPGNEQATYNRYLQIQSQWTYAALREQERQTEAAERAQLTQNERASEHFKRVTAAKKTYADWDTVVQADLPISRVLHDAVLASAQSADVQYYLGSHRDELATLVAESQDYSPSAVQAMRRYLDTLVAPLQRSSPSPRAAAGSTGSALALAPPPAPRPPNPVRTGAVTSADDPPGDGDSLAAHERAYGKKRRA